MELGPILRGWPIFACFDIGFVRAVLGVEEF